MSASIRPMRLLEGAAEAEPTEPTSGIRARLDAPSRPDRGSDVAPKARVSEEPKARVSDEPKARVSEEPKARRAAVLPPLVRGPWPQPSPWFPDRMVPAVLHVPEDVKRDWFRNVRMRYLRQLVTETPGVYLWAKRNPGLRPVSDARFVELVTDATISKFLTPDLDAQDRRLFVTFLDREGAFYKADFRVMALVEDDAESSAVPSVVLFRRDADGRYEVRAIALRDQVFDPRDGDAWELAKYFALQGAGVGQTLYMHPRLHFPTDAIVAIASTRLPDGHVLKELLRPHFRLELGISDSVLHGTRSVLRPGHVYSPYPGTHAESLSIVQTLWTGFRHDDGAPSAAYPPYRFPLDPPTIHSPYGTFLARYFETILSFVTEVLEAVPLTDPDVLGFAHHAAEWIPGFPDAHDIVVPEQRARAIASVIFSITVAHSADHHLYAQIDPREVPFRLKAKPPRRGEPTRFDRRTLVSTRDLVAYAMCSRMYFHPHVVEWLVDVRYDFEPVSLRNAAERFHAALRATERGITRDGLRNYVPLDRIASSVQF